MFTGESSQAFHEGITATQHAETYDHRSSLTTEIESNSMFWDPCKMFAQPEIDSKRLFVEREDLIVAYDACWRLCSKMKTTAMEACVFLENNSDILRSTFNVPYYLQNLEEIYGIIKVQVVEMRMAVNPQRVDQETVKRSFPTVQSKLSNQWQKLKSLTGVSSSRITSSANKEAYSCLLSLKGTNVGETVQMQPGSGETHLLYAAYCSLCDSLQDVLIVQVQDSKQTVYDRIKVHLFEIIDNLDKKPCWRLIYREPEHEVVGKIQLHISYTSAIVKWPEDRFVNSVLVYDNVLKAVLKAQNVRRKNLSLPGLWKWLLSEFARHYGVSDAYTRLRYLSHIMDVATPTEDYISLVYDLLLPVMEEFFKSNLNRLEDILLGEIEEKIEHILALVFENYKSLDEESQSGITNIFFPPPSVAAPVLGHAVKLYKLIHDISSSEARYKLYRYFQTAAIKRCRRHMTEIDEYASRTGEGASMDPVVAYEKMKTLCRNIKVDILADIKIHECQMLPIFIDLPHLSSAVYTAGFLKRLRVVLVACPPTVPFVHVTDFVIATADFLEYLASMNINCVNYGPGAKELFHCYVMSWFRETRSSLLETCKLDTVDKMYDRIVEAWKVYEGILRRWQEYIVAFENVVADVEMGVIEDLERRGADVAALQSTKSPSMVPQELCMLLNSLKTLLDDVHPKLELDLKSWGSSYMPNSGNVAPRGRLCEVNIMLKSKFRKHLQVVIEKLVEYTRLQDGTDSKESVAESELQNRMQPLVLEIRNTLDDLHTIFENGVFIAASRGYWDRMRHDDSWYKGLRKAVSILDETFASKMRGLLEDKFEDKALKPILEPLIFKNELRSMLRQDSS